MSTALFLLRAKQYGYSIEELSVMERGVLYDIMTEAANDEIKYKQLASQEDFDRF